MSHSDNRSMKRERSEDVPPQGRDAPVPPGSQLSGGMMPVSAGMMPVMMVPPQSAPTVGLSSIPGVGVPPAVAAAAAAGNVLAQADKINRELFVGNTPPGTSEVLLREFLNGAMRRVGLVSTEGASPVIQCRVNAKFAFIECATVEDCNRALNLNGIPFLGMSLKVSRPSKYIGPHVPAKTWQELTGQPLPAGVSPSQSAAEEKVNRELFVGNTTPEMTEQMLKDFLGKAMEQVGLTTQPGNPIQSCRVSGKFAFVELRTKEETANALNLNNIPFMGAQLRVGRPSKYTGPQTQHGNWEDILAKYMSGELKLPSQGGGGAAAAVTPATTAADAPDVKPTKVVVVRNVLTAQDLNSEENYQEVLEDTKEEMAGFGFLKNIEIPRAGQPGEGAIYLEYLSIDDATKAVRGLAGKTFDQKKVEATYFDEEKFAKKDFGDAAAQ